MYLAPVLDAVGVATSERSESTWSLEVLGGMGIDANACFLLTLLSVE